jgi:hypothetical protein
MRELSLELLRRLDVELDRFKSIAEHNQKLLEDIVGDTW